MTIHGHVATDKPRRILPHAQLLIDLARVMRNYEHFVHDISLAVLEVSHLRDAGGGTIVELTSRNLGRDPRGLCAIANQTGG